jgi:hypothetical protein
MTLLCVTPLTAPHRKGHEQDHKHDRDRDHDHDDARVNREYDEGRVHHAPRFFPWTSVMKLPLWTKRGRL